MKVQRQATTSLSRAKSAKPWALFLVLMSLTCVPCPAMPIVNGAFDAGLTGWTSQGDVQAATYASLGDNGAIYSLLYQGVAAAPGSYRIEFDFRGLLATNPSGFPDAFFASLYFINDLSGFDLSGIPPVFDDLAALMDLDASGPSNVAGQLSVSPLGSDWTRFTFDFTNNYAYVIPVFELLDFDAIGSNSQVWIDNVEITSLTPIVPEPGTLLLIATGLAGAAAARRRSRTR